jgi:hypothetical protein
MNLRHVKCSECGGNIIKELTWDKWKKVVNFLEFLNLQEQISDATLEELTDCMMSFKQYAEDQSEIEEETRRKKK